MNEIQEKSVSIDNEAKLEVWWNDELTNPKGRYVKVAEITITMDETDGHGKEFGRLSEDLLLCTSRILAAQIEEQHMSPHSSLWICQPGRVWAEPRSGDGKITEDAG